jgi:hypothetical protein
MIVTFVVSTTLVLGGMALGRMIARSLVPRRDGGPTDPKDEAKTEADGKKSEAKEPPRTTTPAGATPPGEPEGDGLHGFPCQLGDVLTRPGGDEAWLAGGVVFSEDVPVAVLFIAPDAGHDRAIYVRREADAPFLWMKPVEERSFVAAQEPPSAIEHEGVRFERRRRLPLRAKRIGTGAPDLGDEVLVAEYVSPGTERMIVVHHGGRARAFHGDLLEATMVDVLPSGRTTLDA